MQLNGDCDKMLPIGNRRVKFSVHNCRISERCAGTNRSPPARGRNTSPVSTRGRVSTDDGDGGVYRPSRHPRVCTIMLGAECNHWSRVFERSEWVDEKRAYCSDYVYEFTVQVMESQEAPVLTDSACMVRLHASSGVLRIWQKGGPQHLF